jgi:NitT/TauT family transport system substrate-binding protein
LKRAIGRLVAAAAAPRGRRRGAAWGQKLDRVRFGTNWVAEAEHGGFYQSAADGTYAKHGLRRDHRAGRAAINNRMLLAVGKLDFCYHGQQLQVFDAVQQGVGDRRHRRHVPEGPPALIAIPGRGSTASKTSAS